MVELLEDRKLMASLPFGAAPADTGEFFLGRVAVTPVLLESNGTLDPNTENWNQAHINSVLANLNTGLSWWDNLLATKSTVHNLDFVVDTQFAVNPVSTRYEPIQRVSNDYQLWVNEFLVGAGFNQSSDLETNIRAFNHSQRTRLNADWAFTVFVVNSQVESDGTFAPGGSFSRAFAFAGGLFFVTPSTRPASTYAHETGHMFWARDEYSGGGNYLQRRGYYNTQNLNAIDLNPNANFQQATSIMSAGNVLQAAYDTLVSPSSTLAMIGWQDSDSDGIFDVLDVPLSLDGVGRREATTGNYRFQGTARVQTLPNLNSSGLQNDITLNLVSRIEFRLNGGEWTTISQPNTAIANLDFLVPLTPSASGTIEIRAIDAGTRITSNIFRGTIGAMPDATPVVGINGFVWQDVNDDSTWQSNERGLAGWDVQLLSSAGQVLQLQRRVEPDNVATGEITNDAFPGVSISSVGLDSDGTLGVFTDSAATTGTKVFRPYSVRSTGFVTGWRDTEHQMRIDFSSPTNFVSVDVIGVGSTSQGRLELYNAAGVLLERDNSAVLSEGQAASLEAGRNQADIAYAMVKGHRSMVRIDNFRYGPKTETQTDALGRYRFENIPAGQYLVAIASDNNYQFTAPASGQNAISLTPGQSLVHIDFGLNREASPWHNVQAPLDVNDDGNLTALDALLVINQLNSRPSASLEGFSSPPYVDTSNDRALTAIDALLIINYLNNPSGGGEGEGLSNRFVSEQTSDEQTSDETSDTSMLTRALPVADRYRDNVGPMLEINNMLASTGQGEAPTASSPGWVMTQAAEDEFWASYRSCGCCGCCDCG